MLSKGFEARYLVELDNIVKALRKVLRTENAFYVTKQWVRRRDRIVAELEAWLLRYTGYRLVGDNVILMGGMAEIYRSTTSDAGKLRRVAKQALALVDSGRDLRARGWKSLPSLLRDQGGRKIIAFCEKTTSPARLLAAHTVG